MWASCCPAAADAELALAELLVLCARRRRGRSCDDVEYAIYGAEGELAWTWAMRAAAGDALVEVSSTVVGDDWAQRWRELHRCRFPAPAAALLDELSGGYSRSSSTWARRSGPARTRTTRLCLELLLAEPAARRTGRWPTWPRWPGVLAIAAAKPGLRRWPATTTKPR
ncbi:MAG: hypothetical protein U0S48_22780 [Solirubrobacteraceae bacterium]